MINVQIYESMDSDGSVYHVWKDGKYDRTYSNEPDALARKSLLIMQHASAPENRHKARKIKLTIHNHNGYALKVFQQQCLQLIEERARQLCGNRRGRFVLRYKGNGIWKERNQGITIMVDDHKCADVWTVEIYIKGGE